MQRDIPQKQDPQLHQCDAQNSRTNLTFFIWSLYYWIYTPRLLLVPRLIASADLLPAHATSKVKVTSYYRPWSPLRENRGIALLLFVNLGALDGGGWSTPSPDRLYPGKDPTPIVQETGWTSEPVGIGAENLAPTGIRSSDHPSRNESLYRLSHPGFGHATFIAVKH